MLDRNPSRLFGVNELVMAPLGVPHYPTLSPESPNDIPAGHAYFGVYGTHCPELVKFSTDPPKD